MMLGYGDASLYDKAKSYGISKLLNVSGVLLHRDYQEKKIGDHVVVLNMERYGKRWCENKKSFYTWRW
jgi:hypothetical protein